MNPSPNARRSPYQGLIPYAEGDAPFFFGREKETRLIIANMFASPLTLLYGASGVGKSSVLRASVAYQLRQRDDLIVVPFSTWQGNPVGDLVQTIDDYARSVDHAAWSAGPNYLNSTSSSLLSLPEYLQACYEQMGRRLMIILDQFEEYFLYHPQGDTFADEFPKAVLQADVPVSFLISIREDSLARLDRFEGRIPNLFDNYLRVEHLNYEAAQAAIEKPIEQYNKQLPAGEQPVEIEPILVGAVLEQVQTGQVILGEAGRGVLKMEAAAGQVETPFLQMVMTRLWEEEIRAGSHLLRLASLDVLGGAERIVRTHLDETMSALAPERQDIAAEVFHYLVTPSGTKIAHTSPDLAEYVGLPREQVTPALEELASGDTRILRGIEPPPDQPGEPRYEIFHDVLGAAILDWRARYMQARELTGQQLKLAAAERQRTKRLRLGLLGLAALLLLMIGLTGWYYIRNRPIDSIAVLPFYSDGSDGFGQLSEDMTEQTINGLSQASGLRVMSYASVLQYKGKAVDPQSVGRELGVRAILVGRISKGDNNNIIISSDLIDTRDKRQLWGLERPVNVSEFLLMPNEIVVGVSDAIGVKLGPEDKKKRDAAILYLKGRNAWNKRTTDGVNEAVGQFEQALELDPNYALAYSGLADCYNMLATYGAKQPKDVFPKAHDAAVKALAIDNNLGEAHAALAYTTFRGDWNWPEAEKEFKQAIRLNGNYASAHQWYANYLAAQGRFDEAIQETRRTQEIDKTSLITYAHFGLMNYFAHRFDQAIADCQKTLALDPGFYVARRYLGLSYAQKGMYKEALEEFEKAIAGSSGSPLMRAEYANTLALSGDTNKAHAELDDLIALSKQKYVSAYHVATVYSGLKDKDRAFEWLEKAFQERADWMVFLKVDPRFDSLHSDPRFKDLLHRMNLG